MYMCAAARPGPRCAEACPPELVVHVRQQELVRARVDGAEVPGRPMVPGHVRGYPQEQDIEVEIGRKLDRDRRAVVDEHELEPVEQISRVGRVAAEQREHRRGVRLVEVERRDVGELDVGGSPRARRARRGPSPQEGFDVIERVLHEMVGEDPLARPGDLDWVGANDARRRTRSS